MKLINVTPHAITVVGEDGASITLAPSGVVAVKGFQVFA